MDHTKHDQKLRPTAVALVHGVGEEGGVLLQALVQAGDRVVAHVGLIGGKHFPFFGVEQEDEPEDDHQKRAVDIVGMLCKSLLKKLALRCHMCGLKTTEKLIEGVEHLLGQAL